MTTTTRREFLKTAGLLSVAMTGLSFDLKKEKPLLSFSTLGCPDWSFNAIVDFAAAHGYNGLEMRGILRELDLTKCAEFWSNENIATTVRRMQDKGLKFVNLGSSAQ
ncbi:MAG TPA: twin-arginine translocation signal domain-containing protein, partial [Cyclobacteriaceae bacterium]